MLQGHPESTTEFTIIPAISQILQYPPLTLSCLSGREDSGPTCQQILCRYLWSSLSGSTSLPWWHSQVSRTWSVPGADYSFSTFARLLDFWASFYLFDRQQALSRLSLLILSDLDLSLLLLLKPLFAFVIKVSIKGPKASGPILSHAVLPMAKQCLSEYLMLKYLRWIGFVVAHFS